MRSGWLAWLAAIGLVASAPAAARPAPPPEVNRWAMAKKAARGSPAAIGEYAAGCVRGAHKLAMSGTGFQRMRPSRGRAFGHPELIAFIEELGRRARRARLGDVLIGDLGQPRGGPAPSGHASHQSGLDVDIWYGAPPRQRGRLTTRQRERLPAPLMVSTATKAATEHWSPRVIALLELAAADQRVDRIFVHPLVKREVCAAAGDDRAWLAKLRPWWGHDDHFHVRLRCPADSPSCAPQPPVAPGDGCDLDWWLDDKAAAERAKGQASYRDKIKTAPVLPLPCGDVLE